MADLITSMLNGLVYILETVVSDLAIHVLVLLVAPYRSIKAVQSNDPQKLRYWLTFWIAYAFVNFVDNFDSILDSIPYYIVFKLIFILFLMFGGSWLLFTLCIEPFVRIVVEKKSN